MNNQTRILSYTSSLPQMKLDIMVGERYRETISISVKPGIEYRYGWLKSFVRQKRPSLRGVDFTLLPSSKPRFI